MEILSKFILKKLLKLNTVPPVLQGCIQKANTSEKSIIQFYRMAISWYFMLLKENGNVLIINAIFTSMISLTLSVNTNSLPILPLIWFLTKWKIFISRLLMRLKNIIFPILLYTIYFFNIWISNVFHYLKFYLLMKYF